MTNRVNVSSAEFIRNIGHWQNEALRRPISITHHGRERLVLASPEEFNVGNGVDHSTKHSLTELRADADAVLENLGDGFLAFDAALRVKRSNTVAEAFIGRSRDLLQGSLAAEFLPSPVGVVLSERLQRVMRTRKHEVFETAVQDRHISVRIFPLVEGAAVLFSNVTEQHDQRLDVGVGKALCAATNRHSQAAGIKLEATGRIKHVHDSFCAWSGFAREAVEGQRFVDLLPASQRREVGDMIEKALQGDATRAIEVTLIGSEGQEVSGVLTMAPIQIDFITHGVMAVWVLTDAAVSAHRAA